MRLLMQKRAMIIATALAVVFSLAGGALIFRLRQAQAWTTIAGSAGTLTFDTFDDVPLNELGQWASWLNPPRYQLFLPNNCVAHFSPQRWENARDVMDSWAAGRGATVDWDDLISDVPITHNGAFNLGCTITVFWGEDTLVDLYPVLDSSGNSTGYGIKIAGGRNGACYNPVRYVAAGSEDWESSGETMILDPATGWTVAHPRGNALEKSPGDTVRWRHRVNVAMTGAPDIDITANTVSHRGTTQLSLTGADANLNNITINNAALTENIPNFPDARSTTWRETTWTVPEDADDGDIFCQYWRWSPSSSEDSGYETSREGADPTLPSGVEQCVVVRDDPSGCPIFTGTTTVNGSNVDVQVEPGATVAWAHTLTRPAGTAFNNVQINFQQVRTEGDNYTSTLQTGSWTGNVPATAFTVPLGVVASHTAAPAIAEGQTYCQHLAWQVEGHPECNGQTPRVCATTSVTGSEEEFVSRVRSCSIRTRSLAGNTVEHCTPWVDLDNTPQSAETHFAKTRDNIRLRHEAQKIAQFQSRQPNNYIPLPQFDHSRTRCATNPTQARNCIPFGHNLTFNPPTSPGQTVGVVLNPSWLNPPMEPWNVAPDGCTLNPTSLSIPGVAPDSCTNNEAELTAGYNFVYEGTGRTVMNADLGTVEADITQSITLGANSVRIIVHRNNDEHTISYRYATRREGVCPGAIMCPPCGPLGCAPGCPSSARVWHGTRAGGNALIGNCCMGCIGPSDGGVYAQDSTGTYMENRHTWIEVMPDGPISAEASFAIPYNYDIEPSLNFFPANPERIQPGGTELAFSASFRVLPRFNEQVEETYATATRPGTRWQVMEFYLPPNAPDPNWGSDDLTFTGMSLGCTAFHPQAFGCHSEGGTGSLNQQSENSDFNLQHGSTLNMGITPRVIGDLEIGTKFCVSAAVMDYSSHNGDTGWVSGNGYTHQVRGEWLATAPECVAIGKQPMVNVLGGIYSDGQIEGTTFDKMPGATASPNNNLPWGAFGSWAEFEAVSDATIRSFATAAALGVGADGVPLNGAAAGIVPPDSLELCSECIMWYNGCNPVFPLPRLCLPPRDMLRGSCSIAPLTFRNEGCPPLGGLSFPLGQMAGARDLRSYGRARDIRHRYSNVDNPTFVSGSVTLGGSPDRITHLRSNGALTINAGTIGAGRTVIVDSTGPVTIAGNITLFDGPYTDVSQIPQVLIFAPTINIDANVTRVDAWLLAGLNGESGTINTCSGVMSVLDLDGTTCGNQLRINGPVMANRVLLHRTYGAGVGMPASARPAEIFFLSPATFLWAHNQAELLRQAFLTYAREVAPRF